MQSASQSTANFVLLLRLHLPVAHWVNQTEKYQFFDTCGHFNNSISHPQLVLSDHCTPQYPGWRNTQCLHEHASDTHHHYTLLTYETHMKKFNDTSSVTCCDINEDNEVNEDISLFLHLPCQTEILRGEWMVLTISEDRILGPSTELTVRALVKSLRCYRI